MRVDVNAWIDSRKSFAYFIVLLLGGFFHGRVDDMRACFSWALERAVSCGEELHAGLWYSNSMREII